MRLPRPSVNCFPDTPPPPDGGLVWEECLSPCPPNRGPSAAWKGEAQALEDCNRPAQGQGNLKSPTCSHPLRCSPDFGPHLPQPVAIISLPAHPDTVLSVPVPPQDNSSTAHLSAPPQVWG